MGWSSDFGPYYECSILSSAPIFVCGSLPNQSFLAFCGFQIQLFEALYWNLGLIRVHFSLFSLIIKSFGVCDLPIKWILWIVAFR